ncbi:Rap1 Myb domain [Phytophthora infestans]|uniref:Telomeric repeat-binding factor 2-interacting protein 1 n=1 Tax=Phytophthora infestans TaxID=4787 RepID=A0A8S9V0A9_PHYIN|nr:Rap1 Myb domain [Phytophthora infestans]
MLFDGLKFFLTRTLSRDDVAEVQRLIEQHGGIVSSSPAGATELVDYDELNSQRPEWVSTAFIKDSVASGKLQDPAKYSGIVFTSKPTELHRKGRVKYSVEDDARLLHFAKQRGWQSMMSVPASVWKAAENEHVTNHTWQSMHEHFKKQLRTKTPKEQRDIMARASVRQHLESSRCAQLTDSLLYINLQEIIRTRLQQQEEQDEIEETGARTSRSPSAPKTPASTGSRTPQRAPSTPATSSPPRPQPGERAQQKRKRKSRAIVVESSPDESEDEENADETNKAHGVYFRSAFAEIAADPSKRARLRALFYTSMLEGAHQRRESCSEAVVSESEEPEIQIQEDSASSSGQTELLQTSRVDVQRATEEQTDEIICLLQLETHQQMPAVVHALYYCSGDVDMARKLLNGASPSGVWTPEDDLLLVDLMVDENIGRSAVDAAVARGGFMSMQVPRDTDAILERVQFLR